MKDHGQVQKFSFDISRKADNEYLRGIGGFFRNVVQGFPGMVDKGFLTEQIAAGAAGHAKFREDQKGAVLIRVFHAGNDLLSIKVDIRDTDLRACGAYT